MPNVAQLAQRFAIPGRLDIIESPAGYPLVAIHNDHATARVALQGAQLLHWAPRDEAPVIWLSPCAKLLPGKSARGGVPICWPWFGPHGEDAAKPAHGFARTVFWELAAATDEPDGTRLRFVLPAQTKVALWPHDTPAQLDLVIGRQLEITLTTRNQGAVPLSLGEAFHTYFQVGDIEQVRVEGLEGVTFADKVQQFARAEQQGAVTINGEIDRVYLGHTEGCAIVDPGLGRRIRIDKRGSRSTVIWNPWEEKAQAMGDFEEGGYRHMLCAESGNALDDTLTLAPGAEHKLAVTYAVEPLLPS